MHAALRALLEQLCPEFCPRCGRKSGDGFCRECRQDFPRIESPCSRCGLPSPCGPCPALRADWRLDALRAPFAYGPPLARHLRNLKYRGQRHLGSALGRLLAAEIEPAAAGVDAIVAVPLHRRRLRSRTFNQAAEIADTVARRLDKPMLFAGVRRILDTQPQTELNRARRLRGPSRAFRVDPGLNGMRIAIVDDVITTGATVNALCRALKGAGATAVEAWSVARSVNR
jgi:ComF family protein